MRATYGRTRTYTTAVRTAVQPYTRTYATAVRIIMRTAVLNLVVVRK